jgi:hypothetical protein
MTDIQHSQPKKTQHTDDVVVPCTTASEENNDTEMEDHIVDDTVFAGSNPRQTDCEDS